MNFCRGGRGLPGAEDRVCHREYLPGAGTLDPDLTSPQQVGVDLPPELSSAGCDSVEPLTPVKAAVQVSALHSKAEGAKAQSRAVTPHPQARTLSHTARSLPSLLAPSLQLAGATPKESPGQKDPVETHPVLGRGPVGTEGGNGEPGSWILLPDDASPQSPPQDLS